MTYKPNLTRQQWVAIRDRLEQVGNTDSPYYLMAIAEIKNHPTPPYERSDARIKSTDVF